MPNRAIIADASQMSGADFFAAVTGRPRKTKAEREAQWLADCNRYADYIQEGRDWAVPPPCLCDARRIAAEREAQLTEPVKGDPLLGRRAA